jgi:hypothetical protein
VGDVPIHASHLGQQDIRFRPPESSGLRESGCASILCRVLLVPEARCARRHGRDLPQVTTRPVLRISKRTEPRTSERAGAGFEPTTRVDPECRFSRRAHRSEPWRPPRVHEPLAGSSGFCFHTADWQACRSGIDGSVRIIARGGITTQTRGGITTQDLGRAGRIPGHESGCEHFRPPVRLRPQDRQDPRVYDQLGERLASNNSGRTI